MFKKVLFILLLSFEALASSAQIVEEKNDSLSSSIQDAVEVITNNPANPFNYNPTAKISKKDIENIYDEFNAYAIESITASIMATPKAYWQYIVPALYVTPLIPQEVLDNPDFLPYKGKKPTIIDPSKQKFADKYLDDLHPTLYTYLMPAQMAGEPAVQITLQQAIAEHSKKLPKEYPEQYFLDERPRSQLIDKAFAAEPAEKYSTGEYLKEKPDTTRDPKITQNSTLKGGDVIAFLQTIPETIMVANKNQTLSVNPKTDFSSRFTSMLNTEPPIAPSNPCKSFADSLDNSLKKGYEIVLKEYGFTLDSWAFTCDKTIKAYRLYSMSAEEMAGIMMIITQKNTIQANKEASKTGKQAINNAIEDIKNRYNANPQDTKAVKWYIQKIQNAFIDSGFENYLKINL